MCLFRFIYFSKIFYNLKDVGLSKLNMTYFTNLIYAIIAFLLRKEVIHPHVPVGIPCYDFTPVTCPTFIDPLLKG